MWMYIVYRNCVFLVSKMRLSYVCLICSCIPIRCWWHCRCRCCCCRFCMPCVCEDFVHFFLVAFWYTSKTITAPAKHRQRNVCLMHWQNHKQKHNTRVKHTYSEKKNGAQDEGGRGSKRDGVKERKWILRIIFGVLNVTDCLMRMCFRSQCYQFVIEGQSSSLAHKIYASHSHAHML